MKNKIVLILICFTVISCGYDKIENEQILETNIVYQDEELFSLLLNVQNEILDNNQLSCIRFLYPVKIYELDQNRNVKTSKHIENNNDLYNFLIHLPINSNIYFNFPLNYIFPNGTIIEINNKADLLLCIKGCVAQQTPQTYETQTYQFITQNAEVYFTGSNECNTNGDYNFNTDKLLDNLIIPNTLPSSFDLSPLLPPVGNQGRQGSCTSWAITYYLKSFQEQIETGLPYSEHNIMSPAYSYNQLTQGICEGTSITATLEILKEKGAVSMQSFPYLDYSCNIQPNSFQNTEASANKISDYKYLSGSNMLLEMKTLLNEQKPIIISAYLDSQFGIVDQFGLSAYREHPVDYSSSGSCHAMLVIGYSDNYNAFKVVNSWGEDWGDDGFVWIDYAAFVNVTNTNADFKVISNAVVAFDE
ncbi:hypothetical protein IL45_13955 [Nonlabens ulvanivorans]|uniref:Papain like protease n=1 Tax=Nonlabens ulvanivorans TaxID=906888 RepID=A0A084JW85_NONUL|nr:hypothetical protein IL45_13955 [Nonlabens ulvanivorans]PRX13659.1 papain like protease [Nonlabens ulvanivorans]